MDYPAIMQLRATRREMVNAYRHHKQNATDVNVASHKLLALYSIECGIKALLMKQNVVEDTDELPQVAQIQHNLMEGLKLLRAPIALLKMNTLMIATSHSRPPQQPVSPANLHQALRYGIPVTMAAESTAEIKSILNWLEGRINDN